MDVSQDCHTEWGKSEREKLLLYINAYMWNLKYYTNEFIYERVGTGEDWESEIGRWKILHVG